jgi:hypothetical protein
MKAYGGVDVQLHHFDLGTRWGVRICDRQIVRSSHCIEGSVGSRTDLDTKVKRKILATTGNRTPVFTP